MSVRDEWTVEEALGAFDEHLRRARGLCSGTRGNYARYTGEFLWAVFPAGRVDVDQIRVGDVIAFYPPGKPTPVLHRIATLEVVDGDVVVTTKGDANGVPDPWTATLKAEPAFRMVGYLPLIGWLPQFRGLLFVVAGLLVGLALVRGLWRETRRRSPSPA